MNQHTEGYWHAMSWTCHAATTVVVEDPTSPTGKRIVAECTTEADARLVAGAPRLLVALQAADASLAARLLEGGAA